MKAVVTDTLCPLMLRPSLQCELADEALYGYTVELLEDCGPDFVRVRTHYRYEGCAPKACLLPGDANAQRWAALPKKVILKGACTVLAAPDVQSWEMVKVTRGALVAPVGEPDQSGWQKISLPDGREGYTKIGYLGEYFTSPSAADEATLRRNITDTARTYLGTHYRWGGKSTLGIDCSGLTAMSYLLNGILIYRDAHIVEGFPIHEIPKEKMKEADLLFFKGHVGLYLGGGRYIHSTAKNGSDGTVINSLDPSEPDYRQDLAENILQVGTYF